MKHFLENIKVVGSLSIIVLTLSICYFLVILPNKKISVVEDFELRKSLDLISCINEAKGRYDNVIQYNCKSENEKQKAEGICVTPYLTKNKAEEVYKDDRELCVDIYKVRPNIF